MLRWGAVMVVIGFGSLILPLVGMQFRLLSAFDPLQPWAGIVVGGVGLLLCWAGKQRAEPAGNQKPAGTRVGDTAANTRP